METINEDLGVLGQVPEMAVSSHEDDPPLSPVLSSERRTT
jgi:hypothetical protein